MTLCRFAQLLMFLALLLGLTSGPAVADELAASRERLSKIQQRIESTERSLKQKTSEVRSLREELRSVNNELRSLARRQSRLNKQIKANEVQQVGTRDAIHETRRQVEKQRESLEQRLVSLYKSGQGGVVKLLFSGMGPAQLDTQFRYMLRVLDYDRALLDDYRRQQHELEIKLVELEMLEERHSKALVSLKQHRKVLAEAGTLKNTILAKVRNDQRLLATLKKELETKAVRLTSLVKQLESNSSSTGRSDSLFARNRGKLPWPVKGKVRISFGPQRHPELGTLFDSNGIEVEVVDETPIKALWSGRVAFANTFKGYGNLVIIDHGDGFHSLYANASRLVAKIDTKVKQGDILAYSGYPGTSGVYLEIRRQGKPVDPEPWFVAKR